jgi:hypothetical protein
MIFLELWGWLREAGYDVDVTNDVFVELVEMWGWYPIFGMVSTASGVGLVLS